jgi:hypothetical protein
MFSAEHLMPIVLAVSITVLLLRYAKGVSVKEQRRLVHYIALFISVSVVAFHCIVP